jgi:hypothetical protein
MPTIVNLVTKPLRNISGFAAEIEPEQRVLSKVRSDTVTALADAAQIPFELCVNPWGGIGARPHDGLQRLVPVCHAHAPTIVPAPGQPITHRAGDIVAQASGTVHTVGRVEADVQIGALRR